MLAIKHFVVEMCYKNTFVLPEPPHFADHIINVKEVKNQREWDCINVVQHQSDVTVNVCVSVCFLQYCVNLSDVSSGGFQTD